MRFVIACICAILLTSVASGQNTLFIDDFNDEVIDTSRWSVSSITPPERTLVEGNGYLTFTGGAIAETKPEFDPASLGGIEVKGNWVIGTVGSDGDQLSMLTREGNGQGINFILTSGAFGIRQKNGTEVTLASELLGFQAQVGDRLSFDIKDTGTDLSFTVSNGTQQATLTASSSAVFPGNHIEFYNRGYDGIHEVTSALDNVSISRLTPLPTITREQVVNAASIDIRTSGALIFGGFRPMNGQMSLSEAAAALGYDHFNWVQIVTHDPYGVFANTAVPLLPTHLSAPYLDPPLGGYYLHPADQLPFYWDESGNSADVLLANHILENGKLLDFEDRPSDNRLQPGEEIGFTTILAGVRSDHTWDALYSFDWASDHKGGFSGESGDSYRRFNLEEPNPGPGGAFVQQLGTNLLQLTQGDRQVLVDNGATSLPEPSTFYLAGIALMGLLCCLKQSRAT